MRPWTAVECKHSGGEDSELFCQRPLCPALDVDFGRSRAPRWQFLPPARRRRVPHPDSGARRAQGHRVSPGKRAWRALRAAARRHLRGDPPRRFERVVPLTVNDEAVRRYAFQQRPGRNDITQSDPWRQNLRQRSNVDDNAGIVGARKRKHGPAVIVKLVIVVVFDDRETHALRANSRSAMRRPAVSVAVVGYWWWGVTYTALIGAWAQAAPSASMLSPSASTGIGTS